MELIKYPRTQHLEGSKLQAGDHDLSQVKYESLAGKYITVEEKFDGANSGISFDENLNLKLQSRGHYLDGGPREGPWTLFKRWANHHQDSLFEVLGDRYLMFGEWMAHVHTVYYDSLPHYFLEFDVYDKQTDTFLDTARRHILLSAAPIISVHVLYSGIAPKTLADLKSLIVPSISKSPDWRDSLKQIIARRELPISDAEINKYCGHNDLMEGLYIKVEEGGAVTERYKWVRSEFIQSITDDQHWLSKPKIPNGLKSGCDIFSPVVTHTWHANHD